MMYRSSLHMLLLAVFISSTQGFTIIVHQQHPYTTTTTTFFPKKNNLNQCSLVRTRSHQGGSSIISSSTNDADVNEPPSSSSSKRKNQKQQKKKRRFAQDVEPIVTIPMNASRKKNTFIKNDNNDNDDMKSNKNMNRNNKNKNNNNGPRNNDVLQKSKSIEELENIMSNRWGTRLEKWTADLNEWEIVYDDEDINSSNNNPLNVENKSVKSGRKVRSKPVLNPWDKEERQKLYNERLERKKDKKKKSNDALEDTNASAFQSAKNRQDVVLDRVRKNQERLRQQKNDNGQNTKSQQQSKELNNNKEQKEIFPIDEFELEFYDEDDEGYEGSSSSTSSYQIYNEEEDDGLEDDAMDFYDNIISPIPVGGPGSSRAFTRTTSTASSPPSRSDNKEQKSGFFFNEAAASEYDNDLTTDAANDNSLLQNNEKKNRKEKKEWGKPLLDEEGNEMYLTLDQATRLSQAHSNVQSENDGDELSNTQQPSWDDVGITNEILKQNLSSMNCFQPLSVQDKACPSIVTGNDVLISTHTGSGKTLAFLAPLAQRLLFDAESDNPDQTQGVKVIIVAPGRELASQIVAVARELFQGTGLTAMLAIGGTPFSRNYEQIRKKKPTFLIGTPGRVAELVVGKPGDKSGKLKIASLQTIVLDECDALLEYEPHREPTAAIMDVLKRRHRDSLQSVLCSATASDLLSTSKLDGYLRETYAHARSDENDLSITAPSTDEGFSRTRVSRTAIHGVVHVEHQRFALDMLRKILYTEPSPQQVLIFVDNSRRVGVVVDKLAEMDIIAAPLHGGQGSEKGDRAEVNKALRDGFVGIVVATEMAARGIDAPYLTHVINLDLPTDASHYAHRAGRCGRGGRPGVVVNVAVGKREEKVPLKFAKSLNIEMHQTEPQGGKLVLVEPSGSFKNQGAKEII